MSIQHHFMITRCNGIGVLNGTPLRGARMYQWRQTLLGSILDPYSALFMGEPLMCTKKGSLQGAAWSYFIFQAQFKVASTVLRLAMCRIVETYHMALRASGKNRSQECNENPVEHLYFSLQETLQGSISAYSNVPVLLLLERS
jgi:hypothetical protein